MTTTGRETTAAAAAAAAVDWERMEAWDRAYYLHNVQGAAEHVWNGVAYQEGNYLYMVDGSRLPVSIIEIQLRPTPSARTRSARSQPRSMRSIASASPTSPRLLRMLIAPPGVVESQNRLAGKAEASLTETS